MSEPARQADGFKVPRLSEIEAARLLANEHRDELHALGLDDEEIRKLADDFVAEHKTHEPADFMPWVRTRVKRDDVP
jgi:hypothetical protein